MAQSDEAQVWRRLPMSSNPPWIESSPEGQELISRRAFIPSKRDTTGLSVFSSLHIESEADMLAGAPAGKVYRFGSIPESALPDCNCTLHVDNDPRGHALIPEQNRRDYEASLDQKDRIIARAETLARAVTAVSEPMRS